MTHIWGDGFDFGELNRAQRWIAKFYERMTGKYPHMKEKYGTIRYEYTYLWLDTTKDCIIFSEILYRAIHKWPKIAEEIVNDHHVTFDNIPYYSAYFDGVCFGQNQSEWVGHPKNRHYITKKD